jgi:predicted MFS family arabinose efflux permease
VGARHPVGRREFATQAFAVAVVAVSPVFLLGGVAVQARADLGFGPDTLGRLVGAFFLTTSLSSLVVGRFVQGIGGVRGLITATLLSAVSLAGVAAAPGPGWLYVVYVLGGFANAFAQPAVNLALAQVVNARRLGVTMGLKQASIPFASLLGGLSVPLIAMVLGWRWTFGIAAATAVLIAATLVVRPAPLSLQLPVETEATVNQTIDRKRMLLLAGAAAFAAASATPLGTFLVDSGVSTGYAANAAALLFSTVSIAGLLSRIALGLAVDLMPRESSVGLMSVLLLTGSLGYLALSQGGTLLFAVGAFTAFVFGWGWAGVFQYIIVAFNPGASAVATGIGQTGASMGAAFGPLAFGQVAAQWSYSVGWLMSAALALVAASMVIVDLARCRGRR